VEEGSETASRFFQENFAVTNRTCYNAAQAGTTIARPDPTLRFTSGE
jgi:hypothetical protein